MKLCTHCGEVKSLDAFPPSQKGKVCKPCRSFQNNQEVRGLTPDRKWCSRCEETHPGSAFPRHASGMLKPWCVLSEPGAGSRYCPACKTNQPDESFPEGRVGQGWYCVPCRDAYMRAWRLMSIWGITPDDYDSMLRKQDGACAICLNPPPTGQTLRIDHDHACCPDYKDTCGKCWRGLLCNECNLGLGNFRDDPKRLLAAVDYLEGGV